MVPTPNGQGNTGGQGSLAQLRDSVEALRQTIIEMRREMATKRDIEDIKIEMQDMRQKMMREISNLVISQAKLDIMLSRLRREEYIEYNIPIGRYPGPGGHSREELIKLQ